MLGDGPVVGDVVADRLSRRGDLGEAAQPQFRLRRGVEHLGDESQRLGVTAPDLAVVPMMFEGDPSSGGHPVSLVPIGRPVDRDLESDDEDGKADAERIGGTKGVFPPRQVGAFHPGGPEAGRVGVAELSAGSLSFLRIGVKISGGPSKCLAIPQLGRLSTRVLQGTQRGGKGDHGVRPRLGPGERVPNVLGQWATAEEAGLSRFVVGELRNVTLKDATELEPGANERVGGMPATSPK